MALPENLDGGCAIVIEDVPPGTGIADLIGAFSAYGPIRFASVGPPAVVGFETEAAAAHALLVASMKSVSLLGAFREKKLQVPVLAQGLPAASRNHTSPSSAPPPPPLGDSTGTEIRWNEASPAAVVAPHTEMMSPATQKLMVKMVHSNMIMQERLSRLESTLHGLGRAEDEGHGQIKNGSTPAPAPAPTQPATCCNYPSSGASFGSARENNVSYIAGRSNPAPREERSLPAPAQPAASRNHPSPSTALAPPLGASPESEIGWKYEASPAEIAVPQLTKMSPIEALAPETKTSPNEPQPPVREKKVQVQAPAQAPVQPITCGNHPSSGASMASATENTGGSVVTGGINPAPREEQRLPLLRSSLAELTGDEYYYKIIRAYLFTFLLLLIIPEMRTALAESFGVLFP